MNPDRTALVIPDMIGGKLYKEESTTFLGLLNLSRRYQLGLENQKLATGDRIIVVMPPSIDMYALIIACMASGIVPVFIDLGMSRDKILMAMEDARAKAIVSVSRLLRFWPVIPALRKIKRYSADEPIFLCKPLGALKYSVSGGELYVRMFEPEAHCLITFTSGSTGRPKGADRTHGCLINQHLALKESYNFISISDVGLTCFPVAALHQFSCGVTTVLPRADMSKIAQVESREIMAQIDSYGVTFIGAAPAFLENLANHLAANERTVPSVKGVVIGGSTVSDELLRKSVIVFPNASIQVFYGSTESEPISHIHAEEVIEEKELEGYLVGVPVTRCEVKIVDTRCAPIFTESDVLDNEVAQGCLGEILVSGEHVLKRYVDNEQATLETKIPRSNGLVWHRTGDMGLLDKKGRILLKGRDKDFVSYRNEYIPNYSLEKKIDTVKGVKRSAIIQSGKGISLCLELTGMQNSEQVISDCLSRCAPLSESDIKVFVLEDMPVDGRHNSKVDRPLLRKNIDNGCMPEWMHKNQQVSEDNKNLGSNKHDLPQSLAQEWCTPKRLVSLGLSLFLTWYITRYFGLNFATAAGYLLNNFYIQLPVVFGGVFHMVVVSRDYWPKLKTPICKKWFGENKTWRGVVAVTVLTLIGAVLVYPIELLLRVVFDFSFLHDVSIVLLGLAGGLGYVLGELPNSYIKRRLGAKPGEMPQNMTDLFIIFDQVDSAVGVALMYWLVGIPVEICLMYLVTFPVTALVVKRYLYIYKLKGVAR